jgi:uncharacterized damage-inducible protein DinB
MTADETRAMVAYDRWANAETFASLRAAENAGVALPPRAIATMAHIIGAERLWLARIAGEPSPLPVWPELDLTGASRELTALGAPWDELLHGTAFDLERDVHYTNSRGMAFVSTVGEILTHVGLHSAHHRGQVAAAVRQAGGTPAYTDYIHYVRTVAK